MDVDDSWRARSQVVSRGVIFVEPSDGRPPPPREVTVDGALYRRFMDYILLSDPVESLDSTAIAAVNLARRRLIGQGLGRSANAIVKTAFELFLNRLAPPSLAEWGCGFDAILTRVAVPRLVGIDIDSEVVDAQRSNGIACYEPDDSALDQYVGSIDVVVAAFVFHFRQYPRDIGLIRHLLHPDTGFVVANVYRRSEESRVDLIQGFEGQGFRVERRSDPLNLCRNHEIWAASPRLSRTELTEHLKSIEDCLRSAYEQRYSQ